MTTVQEKLVILKRKIDYVEINPSSWGFVELRQYVNEISKQLAAETNPMSDQHGQNLPIAQR